MPKEKVKKLSEIIPPKPRKACHDGHWFLLEHQLMQARISLEQVRMLADKIANNPENLEEGDLAEAVGSYVHPVYTEVSGLIAKVRSLLADTEVAERIGEMENG